MPSLQVPIRCYRAGCDGQNVTYKTTYEFGTIIPYKRLLLVVDASPLKSYFKECWHFNGRSGIDFTACESCIREDIKQFFEHEQKGYFRYRWL
jgi:hypothetical protein